MRKTIEWCNDQAAAMLELDPRADVGRPIANLVREPEFIDYLAGRKRAPGRRASTAGRVLAIQLIPYGESQTLLLARDITQAERVETMRRDFVANVSHELRTPLTVLVGFLETVRELKLDPQRVRDYIGMMGEQGARMQRIIEDLLALSVLESAPPPAAERVRVAPLLERLGAMPQALSGGRHTIALRPAAGSTCSAPKRRSRALRQSHVQCCALHARRRQGDRSRGTTAATVRSFSVADTGVGIPAEHIPRLTERFYRVDRSRSRETGGTGLGLAIVKHALARHQASLTIESAPGRGSRFSVHFPASRLIPLEAAATEPQGR